MSTPQTPVIDSKSYASPMSFVGSTRRIVSAIQKITNKPVRITLLTLGLLITLPVVYSAVLVWYVVIFGLFGIVTFPYRLMRRSSRKAQHTNEVQLATMQAMLNQHK